MIRRKLQEFMIGRYGGDQLGLALIIVSFVLQLVLMFFSRIPYIVRLIVTLPIYYELFRMLSKNIQKRRAENDWFLNLISRFRKNGGNGYNKNYYSNPYGSYGYDYNSYKKSNQQKKDKKNFKYFKCPNCATKLRVPKGKGKLTITCPKCRQSFKGKS